MPQVDCRSGVEADQAAAGVGAQLRVVRSKLEEV